MKTLSLMLLVISLFIGCTNTENTEKIYFEEGLEISDTAQVSDSHVSQTEFKYSGLSIIYSDSLQLGDLTFYTEHDLFLSVMGNPDSIVTPLYECGYFATAEVPVNFYYYPGMTFHAYHGGVEIYKIDFVSSKQQLIYSGIKFNNNTAIKTLKSLFPASYEKKDKWTDNRNNKDYELMRFWPKNGSDDEIILKFHDGKLEEFEYNMPC